VLLLNARAGRPHPSALNSRSKSSKAPVPGSPRFPRSPFFERRHAVGIWRAMVLTVAVLSVCAVRGDEPQAELGRGSIGAWLGPLNELLPGRTEPPPPPTPAPATVTLDDVDVGRATVA